MCSEAKLNLRAAILLAMLLLDATGMTVSIFLDVSASVHPAQANDILTGCCASGYDVAESMTHAWTNEEWDSTRINSLDLAENLISTAWMGRTPKVIRMWAVVTPSVAAARMKMAICGPDRRAGGRRLGPGGLPAASRRV